MRRVLFVMVALSVGACAARDPYVTSANMTPSGNWKIERQTDRITGTPLASAQIVTQTSSNSADPKVRPAMLQLTCFDTYPVVRLSFGFKVGTGPNTIVGYRFDERPGHDNIPVRIIGEHRIVVIEDTTEVARFVSELSQSASLVIRIRSLNAGRTTAEFRLDGAAAAIEAAFAGCPVTAQPPPRSRANS